MKENKELSNKISEIVKNLNADVENVGVALIDLKEDIPTIAGHNIDKFLYPASVYKIFIAAEVLRQIDVGEKSLNDTVEIQSPNNVDKDNPRFFPKSTHRDNRPLLKVGDIVTLDYLLDLMLTRSDNTAANVLLDVVDRENINKNIILPNGWKGSEVTRKFLDRLKEEKEYRVSKITISCVRHLAEFFYKVEKGELINEHVSTRLKEYMLRWNRDGRQGLDLQAFNSYYRKGGWLEINNYKWNVWRGIKLAREKGHAIIRYSADAGVVTGNNSHYAIAVLSITKTKWPWVKFPMKKLSKNICKIMESK